MSESHITSRKTYLIVFLALMVFTIITVAVAFLDLGPLNTIVAITIAMIKALLVILIFMHVAHSEKLLWIFVIAGFYWLIILFTLTFSDYLSRSWLPLPKSWLF